MVWGPFLQTPLAEVVLVVQAEFLVCSDAVRRYLSLPR